MDITWYGHACFRIRDRGLTIVTDPYGKGVGPARGLAMPRMRADVVTISHRHPGHSDLGAIRGQPRVLHSAGEYEIGGVFITGVPTFHDAKEGSERGQNIAFLFDLDGMTVCHLGDLGHALSQTQIEVLDGINVLLLPVGSGSTLSVTDAAEVVSLIEPNIVIPMHYAIPGQAHEVAPVSRFLKALGGVRGIPCEMLKVTAGSLPGDLQVMLPELKGQPGSDG